MLTCDQQIQSKCEFAHKKGCEDNPEGSNEIKNDKYVHR